MNAVVTAQTFGSISVETARRVPLCLHITFCAPLRCAAAELPLLPLPGGPRTAAFLQAGWRNGGG